MRAFTEGTGFQLSHVVNNFPWGDLKEATIVDVSVSIILVLVKSVNTLRGVANDEARWEDLKALSLSQLHVNSR